MSIPNKVKKAIMTTYGINDPDVSQLDDKSDLSDFNFNDMQFIRLTEKLNTILQSSDDNISVSVNEVQNCGKVENCIALITSKISNL